MTNSSEDLERLEDQLSRSSDLSKTTVLRTRILKLCPDQSLLYSKSGEQLLKQNQYKKARQKFKRSIQISPDNSSRYDSWVTALYNAREFEEVIMVIEKHHEKMSYPYNTQNTIGICFLHLGDYDTAIKQFQKALSIKGDFEIAHLNWALALYLKGKKEEALERIEKAYQICKPPRWAYQREVGWLKEDLEKEENRIFEDFLNQKMKGFEYLIEMDKIKREGRLGGDAFMNKFKERKGDLCLLENGVFSPDSNKAVISCTRMIKLRFQQYNEITYCRWAVKLLKQRKYQKAKQKFKRSIIISPNALFLYNEWLQQLYKAREFEEAILLAERYKEKFSKTFFAQNTLRSSFLQLGDYESAIKCFQNTTLLEKNYYLGHLNWALALYLQGRKEEAVEMYEGADKFKDWSISDYQIEVDLLKEELEREENKALEDLIKRKIEGFEYFIEMDKKKRIRRN